MKSPLTNDGLTLTDAEFRMFADLIREHVGLDFNESSRFLLERRLSRRIRELELGSVAALIDELTTNETYFFREYSQLRALIDEIIEELQLDREKRGGRPINIWSAGCSSGEEPYSVAMLAREAGLKPGSDVHVYASDISRRMLRKARKGIYREASFRGTDPHLRDKYFIEKDRLWQISDDLKRDVDFIHLNLLDNSKIALLCASQDHGCDPLPKRNHLFQHRHQMSGHSDFLREASPGRAPLARSLGVPDQSVDVIRVASPAA